MQSISGNYGAPYQVVSPAQMWSNSSPSLTDGSSRSTPISPLAQVVPTNNSQWVGQSSATNSPVSVRPCNRLHYILIFISLSQSISPQREVIGTSPASAATSQNSSKIDLGSISDFPPLAPAVSLASESNVCTGALSLVR